MLSGSHFPLTLSEGLKGGLTRRVQSIFNDAGRGERPIERSGNALFQPNSVIWRVHGDVTTMMVGGVTALLLQMLHPAALSGVWDHSAFRNDMQGRLRRTARFIAVTTYGERHEAEGAIARVRAVHEHVQGALKDGTPYRASDPALLAWVHVCEAKAFLDAWIAFAEPDMPVADQDTYFAQHAVIARALGADPVPETRSDAETLIESIRDELEAGSATRTVARMVLRQPPPSLAMAPVQAVVMQAAVDLLPKWAKDLHGPLTVPLPGTMVRAGTFGIARTLRWAFGQQPRSRIADELSILVRILQSRRSS